MKKLLSLVLVLAVVLSSMSLAFAAPAAPDVAGTTYEQAAKMLNDLAIMKGYPDGSFKPENTITRAEFAKIAVVALGLDDAATISKGATPFKDVAADHWASGYVNVASTQGIIAGFPDGTYKPEETINYAQALTILVRMIGYEPVLKGKPWPAAYVAKAAEVGITKDVVLAPTVGASRGNVARLLATALMTDLLTVDSYNAKGEPTYTVDSNKSLLSEGLKAAKIVTYNGNGTLKDEEFVVTDTPALQNQATVQKSTIGTAGSFEFADYLNADDYLGLKVKAWKATKGDNKDKIVAVQVTTDMANVYDGIISKDDKNVKFDANGKKYDTATSGATDYYMNGTAKTFADFLTALGGQDKAQARVVLEDGKVKFIFAWANKTAEKATAFTVKEIKDGYIRAFAGAVNEFKPADLKGDAEKKTKRVEVIKDGKAATIDDIKAGDVVTRIINGSYYRFIVTTGTEIEGTFDSSSSIVPADATVKVAGKEYKLSSSLVMTTNKGDNWYASSDATYGFKAKVKDLLSKSVKIRVDQVGQIATIYSDAASSTYYYGVFSKKLGNMLVNGSADMYVEMYTTDATKVSYALEQSTDADGIAAGTVVQYQLLSSGKVKKATLKTAANVGGVNTTYDTVDSATDSPNKVTITTGSVDKLITGDTKILNVYPTVNDNSAPNVITFDTFKSSAQQMYALYDGGVAKYIWINDAAAQGSPSGVVVATGVDSDGSTITLNQNGTLKTYKMSGVDVTSATYFDKGYYMDFNVSSENKFTGATAVSTFVYSSPRMYRVTSVDAANKIIKVKNLDVNKLEKDPEYTVSLDADIYDVRNKDSIVGGKSISDINQYDYVWLKFDAGSTVKVKKVLIINKDDLKDN